MAMTADVTTAVGILASEIREVATQGRPEAETGEGVGRVLEGHVGNPDLLLPEHREGDPEGYRQHILHVEPDGAFSIVCLVWLPGQMTPIHDHVSWCVVGVHQGEEMEERFELAGDRTHLTVIGTGRNPESTVVWLTPPGDIHRVRNTGEGTAISLHVYGADISKLGSSIRREYDLPIAT